MAKPSARARSTRQWAEHLGCHPETLRRAIRQKQLLATIEPLSLGQTYMIEPSDMEAFLERRRLGRS